MYAYVYCVILNSSAGIKPRVQNRVPEFEEQIKRDDKKRSNYEVIRRLKESYSSVGTRNHVRIDQNVLIEQNRVKVMLNH